MVVVLRRLCPCTTREQARRGGPELLLDERRKCVEEEGAIMLRRVWFLCRSSCQSVGIFRACPVGHPSCGLSLELSFNCTLFGARRHSIASLRCPIRRVEACGFVEIYCWPKSRLSSRFSSRLLLAVFFIYIGRSNRLRTSTSYVCQLSHSSFQWFFLFFVRSWTSYCFDGLKTLCSLFSRALSVSVLCAIILYGLLTSFLLFNRSNVLTPVLS